MATLDNYKSNEQNSQDVRDLRDNFKHVKIKNSDKKIQTSEFAEDRVLDKIKDKEAPTKKS